MAKKALVVLLLNELGRMGHSIGLKEAYWLGQQIRNTSSKLLVEFAKRGIEFNPNMFLAQSRRKQAHWLIEDALEGFGYRQEFGIESQFWRWLAGRNLDRIPDIVVIICPSMISTLWVEKFVAANREVWVVTKNGAEPLGLKGKATLIKLAPELPKEAEFDHPALLMLDIENLVTVHSVLEGQVLEQAENAMQSLKLFLDRHRIGIASGSIACVKKKYIGVKQLARLMAPYGVELVPSLTFGEPSEARILARVRTMFRRRNLSLRKHYIPPLAVVVSGDGHVLPAVEMMQRAGISVWVIAWGANASRELRERANYFFPFHTVLDLTGIDCRQIPLP